MERVTLLPGVPGMLWTFHVDNSLPALFVLSMRARVCVVCAERSLTYWNDNGTSGVVAVTAGIPDSQGQDC